MTILIKYQLIDMNQSWEDSKKYKVTKIKSQRAELENEVKLLQKLTKPNKRTKSTYNRTPTDKSINSKTPTEKAIYELEA